MAPTPQPAGAEPQLAPSSVTAHHSLVLRTSSLLDCQFLPVLALVFLFTVFSSHFQESLDSPRQGLDWNRRLVLYYFISLLYLPLVAVFSAHFFGKSLYLVLCICWRREEGVLAAGRAATRAERR